MKEAALYLTDPNQEVETFLGYVENEASIGTSYTADVVLKDIRCGGIHALLEVQDGKLNVVDLGSRFGTFINSDRVTDTSVSVGETFKIGSKLILVKDAEATKSDLRALHKEVHPQGEKQVERIDLITEYSLLQVSMHWGEQLLEVRTFESGKEISLGTDQESTFAVVLTDKRFRGRSFRIAKYSENSLKLYLPREASGLVWMGEEPVSIDTLRNESGRANRFGDIKVKIRLGDRAEIHLGELTLSFSFVHPAQQLPTQSFRQTDRTFLKIFGVLFGLYLLLFLFITSYEPEKEDKKTLKDVPKHLKRIIMDAGISQALKRQRAAIGQLAQSLQGGRARSEEGKAKAKTQPKKSTKTEKSKTKSKQVAKKKKTLVNKAVSSQPEAPKIDLDSAFSSQSKKTITNNVSVVGKTNTGNTAAALAEGGFARGRYGEGAGGGGKSVGIGALSGLDTGGGMGSGDYGLTPSKGREIKLPESQELVILGGLDPDVIAAIIKRYLPQIKHCYEQRLAIRPGLKGKVAVSFIIGPTGGVQTAKVLESSLRDNPTHSCIIGKVKKWKFPKPRGGGTVGVKYPFLLMSNTGE